MTRDSREIPTRTPRNRLAFFGGCVAVVMLHGWLTWHFVGGWHSMQTPWPFLNDDHTLVYYNAVVGAEFIKLHGTAAGYDPTFMSGYVKTFLGSTNLLAPFVLWLFRAAEPACVYKWYVVIATVVLPVLIFAAAYLMRLGRWPGLAAAVLWLLYFWTDWPSNYVRFGMTAFLSSTAVGVFLGAVVNWYFERPSMLRGCALAATGGLAAMTHPTLGLVMLPPLAVAWLVQMRELGKRANLIVVGAVSIAVLANVHWLWPGFRFRSSVGTVPIFFVNHNVGERLLELLTWPMQSILLLVGIVGLCRSNSWRGARGWITIGTLAWAFALAYPAGWIHTLDVLQPGRHTLTLFTWLCLPAASLCDRRCWQQTRKLPVTLFLVVLSVPAMMSGFTLCFVTARISTGQLQGATAVLPAPFVHVMTALQRKDRSRGRVFFEERNRGVPGFRDPYGNLRLSGAFAAKADREFIGGPWLHMHYQANFSQIGDGRLFGRPEWGGEWFRQYADLYAADLLLCWSPNALLFCRRHPDLVRPVGSFDGLLLAEIKRRAAEWEERSVRVAASPSRIEIALQTPPPPRLVLPYHWSPGWRATPAVRLEPTTLAADPVPFITLIDPPVHTVLRFSPW